MQLKMNEKDFLDFYKNTFLGYSKAFYRKIVKELELEEKITFNEQLSFSDVNKLPMLISSKNDFKEVVIKTTTKKEFIPFYEKLEFVKLYKYSIPLFFENTEQDVIETLKQIGVKEFRYDGFECDYFLGTCIEEAKPIFYKKDDKLFIKFALQKSYTTTEQEQINYRYVIILYLDLVNNILDIRYDSIRYHKVDRSVYEQNIISCVKWLKDNLKLNIYHIDHNNSIPQIKSDESGNVKIFRQMMALSSGGSAELTAAKDGEYCLPFLGEIRELINENSELFESAPEIEKLLLDYIEDKEATALYPYIYIKYIKPVDTDSYIIKLTFDMIGGKYTVFNHITDTCRDLGMERMNHAIEYLCSSGAFTKGQKI